MRTKEFYKEKALEIRNNVFDIIEKGESCDIDEKGFPKNLLDAYPDIHDEILEFIHLVYSFDKNLPLNKSIESLLTIEFKSSYITGESDGNAKNFNRIISYIDFFIHYIDTYMD